MFSILANSYDVTCVMLGAPIIKFISNNTVSLEGDNSNLFCCAINDADAIHPLQVNWYKGNQLVVSDSKHIILHNEADNSSRQLNSTLLFDPINRTDDGEYTCHAFNHNESFFETKTYLTVECTLVTYFCSMIMVHFFRWSISFCRE